MQIIIGLFTLIDYWVYKLVGQMFNLIFTLYNVDIFTADAIKGISTRIYGFLGVLILFKIVISCIQYLINPDKLVDKEKGAVGLIQRTVISIGLLALVPFIFPAAKYIQDSVVKIIPSLVLGIEIDRDVDLQQIGDWVASETLLSFVDIKEGKDSNANSHPINDIETFKDNIDEGCGFFDSDSCIYNYQWIFSVPVGFFLIYILLSLGIDIVIRTIKLGLLQILAPIPIASYINNQENFKKWYQTAFSVYVDLFIRLFIIWLIVYVIAMLESGAIKIGGNIFIKLYIIIGMLFFAKQAPKFICDILGIKSDGFGGIADMFKRGGLIAAPLAGLAAGVGSYKSKRDWGANRRSSVAGALRAATSATARGLYATSKGEKMANVFSNSRDKAEAAANKRYEFVGRNGGYGAKGAQKYINMAKRAGIRGIESFSSFAGVTTGAQQISQEKDFYQSELSLKSNQKKNALAKTNALSGFVDDRLTMAATQQITLSNGNTYDSYSDFINELNQLSANGNRNATQQNRFIQLQNDRDSVEKLISQIKLANGNSYGSYAEFLSELNALQNISAPNATQQARLIQLQRDKDSVEKFMIKNESYIALTNPDKDEGNYSAIAADVIKITRTGTPKLVGDFLEKIGGGNAAVGNSILRKLTKHEALSSAEAMSLNAYIAGDLEHDAQKGISDTTARERAIPKK